jgi:outer membrane lipoprotein SlyB
MKMLYSYAGIGAVLGGVAGMFYGIYDGLQQTDNGFFEALHNITSDDPNIFTKEYWIATRDTLIGVIGGGAVGGLADLVTKVTQRRSRD